MQTSHSHRAGFVQCDYTPLMVVLSLYLTLSAPHAATLDDKGHRGLHRAEKNPELVPPPIVFEEDDIERLKRGEAVYSYTHIKGHDVAVAAVTTWADPMEVWRQIRLVGEYPKVLPELTRAKTLDERTYDAFDEFKVFLDMDVSAPIPSEVVLTARYYRDQRYLVFSQDARQGKEKRALDHAVGYWQITPFEGDKSLVVVMADVLPGFPVPVPMRQMFGEQILPNLVWNLCRTAENSINERTRALNEVE